MILLIFYADATSLLINATKTTRYIKLFDQIGRTQFSMSVLSQISLSTKITHHYPQMGANRHPYPSFMAPQTVTACDINMSNVYDTEKIANITFV